MSFRSKVSKINAENYVQIKQETCANQTQLNDFKTTKRSDASPHFGPFQPQKTCLSNDPNKSPLPSSMKTIKSRNCPPTSSKPTSTKLFVNPPMSSNGLPKSTTQASLKPSSNTPINASPTTSKPTPKPFVNPTTSSNGLPKRTMRTTLKSSSNTPVNAPSTSCKPPTTKMVNSTSSSNPTTNTLMKPPANSEFVTTNEHESVPYSKMHVHTQVSGKGGQINGVGEKSCTQDEDHNQKAEHAKENETQLPRRKKRVWKPVGKVKWTEDINVDPDEVVQVEGNLHIRG